MKTSELTDIALDWAVAKCEGLLATHGGNLQIYRGQLKVHPSSLGTVYTPSTDWSQGGPIIELEKIGTGFGVGIDSDRWEAGYTVPEETGPTPLIAAMRCYVASKMGDEIDVPEGLK